MRSPHRLRLLALFFALLAFAAACSDSGESVSATDNDTDTPADESAEPATAPSAIVSLSPAATEMLFAIGAGDQVIAVDSYSYFPEEAPVTDLSAFTPNVEAIIGFEPDLVVFADDRNELLAGLDAVGIESVQAPAAATLADTYDQIETLGAATGHETEATELVAEMQADIADLVARVPDREEPVSFYHELDNTLYSVTSSTFVGEIYTLAGLVNIADSADPDGELGGYPQLSSELLLEADPDFVFLADTKCCEVDATEFGTRAGFDQLSAVVDGRVVELDDDVASRWGPRVVDFLRAIVDATADYPVAS